MTTMIVLRVIHILSGVFWAGSAFFAAAFLIPAVGASGPAGGAVMQQVIGKRRFPAVSGIAALLTVLSGAGMYWYNVRVSSGAWARSVPGMTYGIGATAAIVTIIVALTMIVPTGNHLLELGGALQARGGPPTPEQMGRLGHLQGRMLFASRMAAACLMVAVIAMATARYL